MDALQLNDVTNSKGRGRDKKREVEMEEEEEEEGGGDDINSLEGSTTEGTTYLSALCPYPLSSSTTLPSPFLFPFPSSLPPFPPSSSPLSLSLSSSLSYPLLYPFPPPFNPLSTFIRRIICYDIL